MSNRPPGSNERTRNPALRALTRAELFLTVFLSGAVVIMVEILGTRIIGPVFGVNLFVWAALLAVTLCALAIGYYGGGVLVDRVPSARLLGVVVLAGGLLLALVPVLTHAVLGSVFGLGPRGGPLLGALLLFAPTLVALGMTGPIAVRLATTDVAATGHRVGSVYAVSTAGSLAGTLLTAFVLIPAFETDQILLGGAALLVLLGAGALARRGRPWTLLAFVIPVLASTVPTPDLPHGIKILERAQSPYGLVEVIEDSNRAVRLLRADHSLIGAHFLVDGTTAFRFQHLLELVQYLRPAAKDLLIIGLGSGALPSALASTGITSDIVEIDPAVVRFARQYFGFSTRGDVYVEDARTFLRQTDRRYDLIVHDTFTGGSTPEHLLSLEVLREIHQLLRPSGVLALNLVGYQRGPHVAASWAVFRTIRAVFPNVRVYRDKAPDEDPDSATNMTFFASDSMLEFNVPANARFESGNCEQVMRSFSDWQVLKEVPDGPLITDEHNPLARLQLAASEEHFRDMRELLPLEVWLH